MRADSKPSKTTSTQRLPLSALLSAALVAFTIECDNEAERLSHHRTTDHGRTPGVGAAPWLTSLVMWLNCLQFIGEDGIAATELERVARAKTNLNGMERWGYITLEPIAVAIGKRSRKDFLIRATRAGRASQEVWRPLPAAIEERWKERLGRSEVEKLRSALIAIAEKLQPGLPDCMPILAYGLYSQLFPQKESSQVGEMKSDVARLSLATLLSRVLLVFATEFERESELSLAISADVVRVLDESGVLLREIPIRSGVSKESIAMAMGILKKKGMVAIEKSKAAGKGMIIRPTASGDRARRNYHKLTAELENRWRERFGVEKVNVLRAALEPIVGDASHKSSRLFSGLEPPPGGWRSAKPAPETLPHYPMVLHRGGYPDGS